MIAIFYSESFQGWQAMRQKAKALTGIEGAIPNHFAAPLAEILQALNSWHLKVRTVA